MPVVRPCMVPEALPATDRKTTGTRGRLELPGTRGHLILRGYPRGGGPDGGRARLSRGSRCAVHRVANGGCAAATRRSRRRSPPWGRGLARSRQQCSGRSQPIGPALGCAFAATDPRITPTTHAALIAAATAGAIATPSGLSISRSMSARTLRSRLAVR